MRVLMLSKALVVGPYQKKAEELARMPGVELLVVVPRVWQEPRGGPQQLEEQYTTGYDLVVAPINFNGKYHLHYYPTIGRIVRRFRPEVFHIDEEPYNFATWHAMQAGKRVGAKMCFFTWQNIAKRYPPPFANMERAVYAGTDAALAGNQAALDILRMKGFSKPTVVIPQFGVDPMIYQPPPKQPRPANWTPTIGYIGRLVEEKGIQVLLEAVALLRQSCRVEIIGSGYYRTDLEVMASRLGIRSSIAFRNSVAARDIPAVLSKLDMLVVPSLTRANWMEQFGRVLIEAMACAVPVIGSDSGEIPNVIGDAGLIAPEGNAEELALRIHDLLEDRDLRMQLGAAGRQRVLKHYTQRQIAQRTYQVYCAMLYGNVPYDLSPPPPPPLAPPTPAEPPMGVGGVGSHAGPNGSRPAPRDANDAGASPSRTPRAPHTPRPAPRPEPLPASDFGPPLWGRGERGPEWGMERASRHDPERGRAGEAGGYPERGVSRRPRPTPQPITEPLPLLSGDFSDDLLDEPPLWERERRATPRTMRPVPEANAELFLDALPDDTEPDIEAEPEPERSVPDWWPQRDLTPGKRPERSWLYDE